MSPLRLRLTITVMSMPGWARPAGGGFQQVLNLAITSWMLLTCTVSACVATTDKANSAAPASQISGLRGQATARSLDVGRDLHLHHLVGVGHGAAGRPRWGLFQSIDHVHSRHHFADHGVLP